MSSLPLVSLSKEFTNTNSILEMTKSLYLNDVNANVRFLFVIYGQEILVPAHKIILAAYSPVFNAMFFGSLKETGNIHINDVSIDSFKDFLSIFYLDTVKITSDNIEQFTYLADKYDVPKGIEMCERFLLDNSRSFDICVLLEFATNYNLRKLRENCRCKPAEVFESNYFITVTLDMLRTILQLVDYKCFEVHVFRACMRWAKNVCNHDGIDPTDAPNLRFALKDCFYLIPFLSMRFAAFLDIVSSNRTLFLIDEIIDIQNFILWGKSTDITKQFANRKNEAATLSWCEELLINFKIHPVQDDGAWLDIYSKQYTTFSSSYRLLFGGFKLRPMKKQPGPNRLLNGDIHITKQMDCSDILIDKIQLKVNIDNDATQLPSVMFDKHIVIIPNEKYTIFIDFGRNAICTTSGMLRLWKYFGGENETSSTLQNDIRIDLHDDYTNAMYNIVSQLHFNRV
ncbi:BTB/POZ domain-containing protein 6-B-like [Sitodiplosis mosellana]|uniref:BTB/POZ domain-containing protein 6-B-like n=1 Tax=Sitodiplosis mosellana TaxID=263140 RepID=UPI002444DBBA|nr:BTB/POZ domain-containing protein 6-B-like [Sitodiplosis mosellana]